MPHNPPRILGVILFVFALLVACTNAFGQVRTIEVGIYEQRPDVYIMPDGSPGGILGELLNRIAQKENWELHTTRCAWKECLDLLAASKIDLLPDVVYTEQRAQKFDFHHVPALHSWSQIYARTGNTLRSIQDLAGKHLVVLSGSAQYDYLTQLFQALNLTVDMTTVANLEDGFNLVQAGRADAVASDYFFGEMSIKSRQLTATPIIFQPTDLYFATPKGRKPWILAAIDRHLSRWQGQPDSFYFQMIEHWQNPTRSPELSYETKWMVGGLSLLLAMAVLTIAWMKVRLSRQMRRTRSNEDRLYTILDSIDAMITIKDQNLRYVYINQKLCDFYGLTESDLLGRRDEDFVTDPQSLAVIRRTDEQAMEKDERLVLEEELRPSCTDETRTFLSIKIPLRNAAGNIEAICAIATDITGRTQAEEVAERLTFYDTLTNLPNRRLVLDRLAHSMESARQGQSTGALLLLDLDNFKKVNDTRGHSIGDQLLCAVAGRLTEITRERDTVARIGADEFIILLNQLGASTEEGARNAMYVADKARQSLIEPFVIDNLPCVVTASTGLTLLHTGSGSVDDVMREADMAMYRAKEAGGNRVTFYERDMQSEAEQRLWLEHDLTLALNTPQLSMHLQPQYGPDGRVTGAELLARWNHPTRGMVSPALFIPIAEETGLIGHLGEWSLNQACDLLLDLQAAGETYPISLNVSPKRLMEPSFLDYVESVLERTGAPGNRLIFEITEGVLIHDIQHTTQRMRGLSLLGIRFSIDDFGTGYSNLAYLKRLPIYELKIDKSLVQDTPSDADSSAIARLILAMAAQLDLRVVAEGVETQAQADFLFENSCDALQGYLMARPMPIPEWLAAVHTRKRPETPPVQP
ncbi:MAG: EAL domain-containing protein [Alcaligenaceae bacterium]|nr:EAL domain-containing protein [Alcaligenaceae bacterium]